jgi:transposase
VDPERLVFVDESGVNTSMVRRYARSPSGERAVGSVPLVRAGRLTVVGALSLEGMLATQSSESAMSSAGFLAYLTERLIPALLEVKPDAIVVLDNLRPHRVKAVRQQLLGAGLGLIYLPAYSPDLSPIEPAWSKFKALLRTLAARTKEALVAAVTPSLLAITAADARGYFTHCGYDPAIN